MGVIFYNGQSSKDYHIEVEQPPSYAYPERNYDIITVPGRNGDLYIDTGSYKNVDRKYDISLGSTLPEYTKLMTGLSQWLHSATGYTRLEDSYEPDYYRMAVYKEGNEITNLFHQGGKGSITFTCKPQRYLKLGERSVTYDPTHMGGEIKTRTALMIYGPLRNTTNQDASPIIKIYPNSNATNGGSISFALLFNKNNDFSGQKTIFDFTIQNLNKTKTYIIDSELQEVYDQNGNNQSANLSFGQTKQFPKLLANGYTWFQTVNTIAKLEVIPRWWVL